MIAFLDASALIDLVDGDAFSAEAVKQQLLQLAAAAQASRFDIRLAISRLSWLECRVGPLRRSDPTALRTTDALQAACCQQLGPSIVMVTGDAGFRGCPVYRWRWCRVPFLHAATPEQPASQAARSLLEQGYAQDRHSNV